MCAPPPSSALILFLNTHFIHSFLLKWYYEPFMSHVHHLVLASYMWTFCRGPSSLPLALARPLAAEAHLSETLQSANGQPFIKQPLLLMVSDFKTISRKSQGFMILIKTLRALEARDSLWLNLSRLVCISH